MSVSAPLRPLFTLLALPALFALGCAFDEKVSPVGLAATATDAGPDAPEPLAPDAGPWKRSILTRNPVGGPSGNLLVDGDFEHSTLGNPGAQTGWRAFSVDGSGVLEVKTETGGLCRSGLRCAVFEPKTLQLLRGTAARSTGNIASIWARLPPGTTACKLVDPILIRIDDSSAFTKLASDKVPDENGDCHYTARIAQKTDALALYLDSTLPAGTFALLDSAFLGPDDGTIHPLEAEFWAPPPEVVQNIEAIRTTIQRSAPPPRKPPPHSVP